VAASAVSFPGRPIGMVSEARSTLFKLDFRCVLKQGGMA